MNIAPSGLRGAARHRLLIVLVALLACPPLAFGNASDTVRRLGAQDMWEPERLAAVEALERADFSSIAAALLAHLIPGPSSHSPYGMCLAPARRRLWPAPANAYCDADGIWRHHLGQKAHADANMRTLVSLLKQFGDGSLEQSFLLGSIGAHWTPVAEEALSTILLRDSAPLDVRLWAGSILLGQTEAGKYFSMVRALLRSRDLTDSERATLMVRHFLSHADPVQLRKHLSKAQADDLLHLGFETLKRLGTGADSWGLAGLLGVLLGMPDGFTPRAADGSVWSGDSVAFYNGKVRLALDWYARHGAYLRAGRSHGI